MSKIVIIGCGNVGMSYAYSLLNQNLIIDEIILIDINTSKLIGKLADLNHSLYTLNRRTKISIGNYSDCNNADIVCITAGPSQSNLKESRMEDLFKANNLIKDIITEINKTNFSGIYLLATNPLDVMTYVTCKYSNYNKNKVIGSGTLLDTARLHFVLSDRFNIPIEKVAGYVLGEHGNSQFICWSSVNIENINNNIKLEIEETVRKMGFEVAKSQGFTCYGIASALFKITKAILLDEKIMLPVCSYIEDYDIFISTPSVVGKNGIEKSNCYNLVNDELLKFENSVNILKSAINKIQ